MKDFIICDMNKYKNKAKNYKALYSIHSCIKKGDDHMLWQLKKALETWQTLQETTTKLLGVSLLLIDSHGEPVTEITNACLFCEAARSK